jgi:hypothetical protein
MRRFEPRFSAGSGVASRVEMEVEDLGKGVSLICHKFASKRHGWVDVRLYIRGI